MSDVTRWAYDGTVLAYRVEAGRLFAPTGNYIDEHDHLTALERVRVETLREVKVAVLHLPVVGRLAGTDSTLAAVDVLAAIDRLVAATATPLTRCETCGHPREHHMDPPLGCYCRCTASDKAAPVDPS